MYLDGKTSEHLKIECGFPQGSVLGPKLFILFRDHVCEVCKLLRFVLFADDILFLFAQEVI